MIFVPASISAQDGSPQSPEHEELDTRAISKIGVEHSIDKWRRKVTKDVFDDLSSRVSKGSKVGRNRRHHNTGQSWHHSPSEEQDDPQQNADDYHSFDERNDDCWADADAWEHKHVVYSFRVIIASDFADHISTWIITSVPKPAPVVGPVTETTAYAMKTLL